MTISPVNRAETVQAIGVRFAQQALYIALSDGREVRLPLDRIPWLQWLRAASDAQRAQWSIEPGGDAIYWDGLDDGVELGRVLTLEPLW